ncbi:MAG: hypothetical protein J0L64_25935 [Acidobacteria bacterium]|nr:hypothetical protein [Acidobacteriota bacterium]
MTHRASPSFWTCYRRLPTESQRTADKAFGLLKRDPRHPSLQLKKLDEVWSVRIGLHHRALAAEATDGFLWFWIGTHAEYDRIAG